MHRHAWWLVPAVLALAFGIAGIGVPATDGGRAAVDEPQYLLTAQSLAEDGDLDIDDELAAQRWRTYYAQDLPVQTAPQADGRQVSPHDPLLPALIAAPTGILGWVGAKTALSLLAAACAALLAWTAARRFDVPTGLAGAGASIAFASPPLAVYAQQVYPEMPAALAALAAVAAMTADPLRRRHVAGALVAITALPWLGSKYVPVAIALTIVLTLLVHRRAGVGGVVRMAAALIAAGVVYLVVHQAVWGGWTVYASGDHFQGSGEFSVVGVEPNYFGRSLRLVSLLADRHYGLVPWQPAWLLVVPAMVALALRRPRPEVIGWLALLGPVVAGWATATWVALTAHGFWWPGRQVVVVLPLAAVAILWLTARVFPRLRWAAAALGMIGVLSMMTLIVQGWLGELQWVVDHTNALAPAYRLLGPVLPDYAVPGFMALHLIWTLLLIAVAGLTVWRLMRSRDRAAGSGPALDREGRQPSCSTSA